MSKPDYPDGHDLGDGLVVSRKGGFNVAVYRCACKREQTANCHEYNNRNGKRGLNTSTAERFGWRRINGIWECPFCTNNTDMLFKVFDGPAGT